MDFSKIVRNAFPLWKKVGYGVPAFAPHYTPDDHDTIGYLHSKIERLVILVQHIKTKNNSMKN